VGCKLAHGKAAQASAQILIALASDVGVPGKEIEALGNGLNQPAGDFEAATFFGNLILNVVEFVFGPEVVETLEIPPKLRAGTEEMREAQGGIAGDGAGSVQDLRDAIRGHVHLARQFRRAQSERFASDSPKSEPLPAPGGLKGGPRQQHET